MDDILCSLEKDRRKYMVGVETYIYLYTQRKAFIITFSQVTKNSLGGVKSYIYGWSRYIYLYIDRKEKSPK